MKMILYIIGLGLVWIASAYFHERDIAHAIETKGEYVMFVDDLVLIENYDSNCIVNRGEE